MYVGTICLEILLPLIVFVTSHSFWLVLFLAVHWILTINKWWLQICSFAHRPKFMWPKKVITFDLSNYPTQYLTPTPGGHHLHQREWSRRGGGNCIQPKQLSPYRSHLHHQTPIQHHQCIRRPANPQHLRQGNPLSTSCRRMRLVPQQHHPTHCCNQSSHHCLCHLRSKPHHQRTRTHHRCHHCLNQPQIHRRPRRHPQLWHGNSHQ